MWKVLHGNIHTKMVLQWHALHFFKRVADLLYSMYTVTYSITFVYTPVFHPNVCLYSFASLAYHFCSLENLQYIMNWRPEKRATPEELLKCVQTLIGEMTNRRFCGLEKCVLFSDFLAIFTKGIFLLKLCATRVMLFLEKPQEGLTESRLASVVFYCLRKESLPYISQFLYDHPDVLDRTFGKFWVSLNCVLYLCLIYSWTCVPGIDLQLFFLFNMAFIWVSPLKCYDCRNGW